MAHLAAGHSMAWRRLPVSLFHVLALGRLLQAPGTDGPRIGYVHLLDEVIDAMEKGEAQLAALIPPVSMAQVAEIARDREMMPPKSTYFYPKLLSGLVFNSLTGH
jgi:uncharacterized protein (DUF1015 family)